MTNHADRLAQKYFNLNYLDLNREQKWWLKNRTEWHAVMYGLEQKELKNVLQNVRQDKS